MRTKRKLLALGGGLLLAMLAACGQPVTHITGGNMAKEGVSKDAYVEYDASAGAWRLGTSRVEQVLVLDKQGYRVDSIRNKLTGSEYVDPSYFNGVRLEIDGKSLDGMSLGLKYVSHEVTALAKGELRLDIVAKNKELELTDSYTVYPGTGLIANSYEVKNLKKQDVSLSNPVFSSYQVMGCFPDTVKLVYFTGGGNFTGSQEKRELPMSDGFEKRVLSYDEREVRTTDKGYADSTQDVFNGYSGYLPCFMFQNARRGEGMYFGFEYAGMWKADFVNENGVYRYNASLDKYQKTLTNGDSYVSPRTFVGVFEKDLDDASNDLLFYQYEYQWDYIDELYPLTFTDTWSLTGQSFNDVWRLVNEARYLGIEVVHLDDNKDGVGWYDKKMDWNAQYDLEGLSDYIRASGMKSSIWLTAQHYDYTSSAIAEKPGLAIPDLDSGYYGPLLCVGNAETLDFMKQLVVKRAQDFGLDMIKMDGWMMCPCPDAAHSHNTALEGNAALYEQYYGYLDYMKYVADNVPGFRWHLCASGGELQGFDFLRYATFTTTTDGNSSNPVYNLSYLYPSGKFQSGYASSANYSPANTRTYGFAGGLSMTLNGIPGAPDYSSNMESLRKDISLYKYLRSQGVLGRYSRQYHLSTAVMGGSIFMKTDGQASRGVIMGIPAGYDKKIFPRGLKEDRAYTVSYYLNGNSYTATGRQLMEQGVSVAGCGEGELVFFNLDRHPGSGRDTVSPVLTGGAAKQAATYAGRAGVAVTWSAGSDDNWLEYYEIFRDGVSLGKVSVGEFYFDEGGSVSSEYEIVAVDGDGNRSGMVSAKVAS